MSATAADVIASMADEGSFDPWDEHLHPIDPGPDYAAALARARAATGLEESVVTGRARIGGHPVALVVSEFAFLGGSVGTATAERITRAVERATAGGLPLVAAPCSGGTRMQEGTVAFVRMVEVTAALAGHRAAGLPYLVYLRHPTTGGVFASWGSLGHATFAEPGALLGFLGPRVYQALEGRPFPAGVQTAENLARHGLVDGVVPLEAIGGVLARTLTVLTTHQVTGATDAQDAGDTAAVTAVADAREATGDASPIESFRSEASDTVAPEAWEAVLRSRDPNRPAALDLLGTADDVVRLSGDALVLATARFGSVSCVVLAQDRRAQRSGRPLGPAALRAARRGVALATGLGLPLVSVVDTPGADLSPEAEEGGLSAEISACLADLVRTPARTLCVVLGEGCGGGALALLPADRVLAARHAWIAPLPPEGASAIVHRTVDRAAELAAAHGITASDLARAGIVDRIVPERPDAAAEPAAFVRRLGRAVTEELAALVDGPVPDRAARART